MRSRSNLAICIEAAVSGRTGNVRWWDIWFPRMDQERSDDSRVVGVRPHYRLAVRRTLRLCFC